MAIFDTFKNLFRRKDRQEMQYAQLLDGSFPVFSQFGQNIYASDLVQMAIDCIATEISKLKPKHIKTDNDEMQSISKSSFNRLFKFSPNPLMTTRDFLEKIIWLLYLNYNVFIYPMRNLQNEYLAFYPLNPTTVVFLQDSTGKLFVEMKFPGGQGFTLPYSDIIHLRKKFSMNDIMGGGHNGQPDNAALLKVLEINDDVLQGLGKAIKTSFSVRGIIKINTMMDDERQQKERERFEAAIKSGTTGILPMDLKGDYVDLKPDPKIVDRDTMAFIQDKILHWYGVPLKILSGTFNDGEYQAFYEKTLEPIVISMGQAFTKALFTQREIDFGNEIVFFHRDMMYLSTASKLKLLEVAGAQGLLTDDQKLRILGYPPLPDGAGRRRTISLNYVSTEIADEYQLLRAQTAGKGDLVKEKELEED